MDYTVLMTAYNRAHLLDVTLRSIERPEQYDGEILVVEDGSDGGKTADVCARHGARWLCRSDRPDVPYSNQSVPLNLGIRESRGTILVLQNAECRHVTPQLLYRLIEATKSEPNVAHFCHCEAEVMENGVMVSTRVYCGPQLPLGPFFFCGAIMKEHLTRLGGFDEDFTFYGWEDVDMNDRLRESGIELRLHNDWHVIHQWHPYPYKDPTWKEREAAMKALYEKKRLDRGIKMVGRS